MAPCPCPARSSSLPSAARGREPTALPRFRLGSVVGRVVCGARAARIEPAEEEESPAEFLSVVPRRDSFAGAASSENRFHFAGALGKASAAAPWLSAKLMVVAPAKSSTNVERIRQGQGRERKAEQPSASVEDVTGAGDAAAHGEEDSSLSSGAADMLRYGRPGDELGDTTPASETQAGINTVEQTEQLTREAAVKLRGSSLDLSPNPPPPPPASSRPRGPPRAPPKPCDLGGSGKAGRSLPDWCGPLPPDGLKSQRVINWQPIRQPQQWEGSVWERIYRDMRERGVSNSFLPDWDGAFMRRAEKKQRSVVSASTAKRVLPQRVAFKVDLSFAMLVRMGFSSCARLAWVVGSMPKSNDLADSSGSTTPREAPEVPEQALEALLGLLSAAKNYEQALKGTPDSDSDNFAPSEKLLRRLLGRGSLVGLIADVADVLNMVRFQAECARVEHQCAMAIDAASSVIASKALPVLLEGVLLLGNYVNSSSKCLGGALGVSLDSLSRLDHTKCLEGPAASSAQPKERGDTALGLLVNQLRESHGHALVDTIAKEIESCEAAREIDPEQICTQVEELTQHVKSIEGRLGESGDVLSASALAPERLHLFLGEARPRVVALQKTLADLSEATASLRFHFAEASTSTLPHMLGSLGALAKSLRSGRSRGPPLRQSSAPSLLQVAPVRGGSTSSLREETLSSLAAIPKQVIKVSAIPPSRLEPGKEGVGRARKEALLLAQKPGAPQPLQLDRPRTAHVECTTLQGGPKRRREPEKAMMAAGKV